MTEIRADLLSPAGSAAYRAATNLSTVRAAAIRADTGRSAAPFADGRNADANGLAHAELQRLARISTALDPDQRIAPSRILAALNDM